MKPNKTPVKINGDSVIYQGDCRDILPTLDLVDAVVTDPPYGLEFMGKGWDGQVPGVEFWTKVYDAMKPGAHLLAFGGTRTYHRLVCAIEDAGFDVRDCIMFLHGSGFPKSHNISKAIDRAAGAKREIVGVNPNSIGRNTNMTGGKFVGPHNMDRSLVDVLTAPATEAAKKYEGFGTGLKPSFEPIVLCRKPFKGTVANNVLEHGVGGLNIEACRVAVVGVDPNHRNLKAKTHLRGDNNVFRKFGLDYSTDQESQLRNQGRWPANIIHDGSDEVLAGFPYSKSGSLLPHHKPTYNVTRNAYGHYSRLPYNIESNEGSAARFFYCAKSSKKERGEFNTHPCVKPLSLMRYLCRLITPPGGTILDPFMGSGSTLIAAGQEGFKSIGIDENEHYCEIANKRLCG